MKEIKSGQNQQLSSEERDAVRENTEKAFGKFLTALGYDWQNDPNMEGTPRRVAKMYLDEVTKGAYDFPPKITSFKNTIGYDGVVFEGGITVKSLCSHHFQPFFGTAHIAYIVGEGESDQIIGLSKLNRIVDHFSRRPQIQEQLTKQIFDEICRLIPHNRGVAVLLECKHLCVYLRGVENENSVMKTAKLSGFFFSDTIGSRKEFYAMVADMKG